jgi:hypothetical protein
MAALVSIEVALGRSIGIWNSGLATDTVLWFVATGLSIFLDATEAGHERHFFLRQIVESLGLAAIMGFYVNVFPLDLWAELVLVPIVATLALTSQVAEARNEQVQVSRLLDSSLYWVLGVLALRVAVLLAKDWRIINKEDLLKSFALPIWLVIGLTPYIYFVSMTSGYGQVFFGIKMRRTAGEPIRSGQRLAVLLGFRFNIRQLADFGEPWLTRLAEASTYAESRVFLQRFRHHASGTSATEPDGSLRSALREFSLKKFWAGGILNRSIASALEREGHRKRDTHA